VGQPTAAQTPNDPAPRASPRYTTREGQLVPYCEYKDWLNRLQKMQSEEQLYQLQVIEGCGYSCAMVVRFALGHTADKGSITVFAGDTFFGCIALAAARHLLNSGAHVKVVIPHPTSEFSDDFTKLLIPIDRRGGELFGWSDPTWGELSELVENSHNVLCGFTDAEKIDPLYHTNFAFNMNESRVPVHCIGAPIGACSELIPEVQEQLFASSTLSLGLPFSLLDKNLDLVGRHYLCDVGWALSDYRQLQVYGTSLFAEQPVIQLNLPS
jgi:hypothetical protein